MVETTIDCMRWMFRPFRGTDVRRLAAAILFAVALPRFDFWPVRLLAGRACGVPA